MINDVVYLRQQAERCQRLASGCTDVQTAYSLRMMAEDYAQRAREAEATKPAELMLVLPTQS
ncbi:hypothetical protein HJG53_11105 [Sphingomonas sp. ID1715]|uniref:hypothetical protein n=1 Tax=Sphingomonas sp. ID1715 TaxID=1656898 RepID=UPI0014887CC0|nr:hypothetical protein [Sphingomonas sp. ID1715]NNM77454.1 hypothetical protein [Sphingomonas sp. ID1715]